MDRQIPLNKRIIFALDLADPREARQWVSRLSGRISYYKVGMELFLAGGWEMVRWILDQGLEVMLDLKLFDVPRTVDAAVQQVKGSGVTSLTLHGDRSILEAANRDPGGLSLLAVTVLTSMGGDPPGEHSAGWSTQDLVLKRARLARDCGCAGIVCSGLELPAIRRELGHELLTVVPGVRPGKRQGDDQKRVVEPGEAFDSGADHVVIGRPIRESPQPEKLVDGLQEAIESALHKRRDTAS